jgi:hypothetical protein
MWFDLNVVDHQVKLLGRYFGYLVLFYKIGRDFNQLPGHTA